MQPPVLSCDGALLVGIRLDQACIDRKAFAANQIGRDARLPLEYVAEYVSIRKRSLRTRENAE
jgi:hypothetical protein